MCQEKLRTATDVCVKYFRKSLVNDACQSDLHIRLEEEEEMEICRPAASLGRSITPDRLLFFSVDKGTEVYP